MAYIDQFNVKGVASGIGAFIVLYLLYTFLINSLIGTVSIIEKIQPIITFGGYLVWLASGYFAAFFSKKAGILNGAITGVLTPIIMVMYMVIGFGSLEGIQETVKSHGLYWLFTGFILCGIGGLMWDIQKRLIKK
tara:strand:+ start:34415 stop:34819 length:405 start_codon:yes stop_codon:yes gene_type:complete